MDTKSDQDPSMIKIRKNTSKKRRKKGISLVKDYKDDDEFNDKDSKSIIPIKEYARPFIRKSYNNSTHPVGRQKVKFASERAPP
jgi:hypothetical protein